MFGLGRNKAAAASTENKPQVPATFHVFVLEAMKQVLALKEVPRKYPKLKEMAEAARAACESKTSENNVKLVNTVLTPLELACRSTHAPLMVIALDCLGKLISYNFFAITSETTAEDLNLPSTTKSPTSLERTPSGTLQGIVDKELDDSEDNGPHPIINRVVDTIYDCFTGESTDDKVQLQICKALLAAVSCSAPGSTIHQAALLKAVRTAYNIFLLTKKTANQAVAQSTLSQLINQIFGRCKIPDEHKGDYTAFLEKGAEHFSELFKAIENPGRKQNLATNTERKEVDKSHIARSAEDVTSSIVNDIVDNVLEKGKDADPQTSDPSAKTGSSTEISSTDVYILDAFLIFRALCRLSIKALPEVSAESQAYALKSKVLSLHLLNIIVQKHFIVVSSVYPILVNTDTGGGAELSPVSGKENNVTTFVSAVKTYLCVSLSRNGVSLVPEILDRSLSIFCCLVSGMRHFLKKEIEVFFTEIFLGILESRSNLAITYHQKLSLLKYISKLCMDPQTVVEIYLNYDCDSDALDNTFERMVNILSKILTSRDHKLLQIGPTIPNGISMGLDLAGAFVEINDSGVLASNISIGPHPAVADAPSPVAPSVQGLPFHVPLIGNLPLDKDQSLKFRALECISSILKSLVCWSKSYGDNLLSLSPIATSTENSKASNSGAPVSPQVEDNTNDASFVKANGVEEINRFEAAKHQKQAVKEAVRLFNWKYKKGIQYLLDQKILTKDVGEFANFLLYTPGLNKKMIGEYLGEGEEWNIQVMHAFVDLMDFTEMTFVSALRTFLQSFRLPGEAQKIDRFMLKFAERFLLNNPKAFSNADCAYVLAYSVIMLNTDLHNPQIKKRMTKNEFLKNNRGINDNQNLPDEYLGEIYDEILNDEIKLKDEHEQSTNQKAPSNYDNMSSKQKKEAFLVVSEQIATKSEAVFKGMASNSTSKASERKGVASEPFHIAKHAEHVRSMFEVCWMSILAGISSPLQEIDASDVQSTQVVLVAFRCAVYMSCIFDVDTARNAFISTLTKYGYIGSMHDLVFKPKLLECVRALLEVAVVDGNWLKTSWLDVLRSVSSLESILSAASSMDGGANFGDSNRNGGAMGRPRPTSNSEADPNYNRPLTAQEEQQAEATAQSLLVAVDRIFTLSNKLSGTAVVDFVKSLCQISIEEIQQSTSSSTLSTVPRMYSLTKLVEICSYNMNRIRIEWSNMWLILGDHIDEVGCHQNQHVGFFAVDSLRQLSVKFLEKEELSNFKFQKDFLKPFEHIIANNGSLVIKDMVLRCINQIVQARSSNIRSGWKSVFSVLTRAAKEQNDGLVTMAFDLVKFLQHEKFNFVMVSNNTFSDYITCLVEFARNRGFPKINLQSVELLKASVPKILHILSSTDESIPIQNSLDVSSSMDQIAWHIPESKSITKSNLKDDPVLRFWFPIHFGLYEIIMTCDLEVRTRALRYLFETLKEHGPQYTPEFWDVVSRAVIFPIFDDLRLSRNEKRQFENREDMTVWLNTTLIQALRQLVDLFSFSFENLESFMMDGVLDLIKVCFGVQQENETLAKIGSSCLQQLIENNAAKFTEKHWDQICSTLEHLFDSTTAETLFEADFVKEVMSRAELLENEGKKHTRSVSAESLKSDDSDSTKETSTDKKKSRTKQLKRDFQQIIQKSVLHLLVIQTTLDIAGSSSSVQVYRFIRSRHLMILAGRLERSYLLAKKFNSAINLRIALFKIGFMKQLPNLQKQETTSVHALLTILYRMFSDAHSLKPTNGEVQEDLFDLAHDRLEAANNIEETLKSTGIEILRHFNTLAPTQQQRNINTWTPVVVKILKGLAEMPDEKFRDHCNVLYSAILDVIAQHEINGELKTAIHAVLLRVNQVWNISK